MDKDSLLDDMEVQFAPEDHKKYGAGWHTYSELAVASLPGQELMVLEALFGVPMPAIMDNFRKDATYANMACAWLACGRPGEWRDFNPMIMLAEWRTKAAEVDAGKSPAEQSASEPGATAGVPEGFGALPITPAPESTS